MELSQLVDLLERRGRFWRNWSIRTRLMLMCGIPVVYLLGSMLWAGNFLAKRQIQEDLRERSQLIVTALSERLETHVVNRDLNSLNAALTDFLTTDSNIVSIEILDSEHKFLTSRIRRYDPDVYQRYQVTPYGAWWDEPADDIVIEQAIYSRTERTEISPTFGSYDATEGLTPVAHIRLIMTPNILEAKLAQRSQIQLLLSIIAGVLSMGLAWTLSIGLTQSLRNAIETLREIRTGRLNLRVNHIAEGEIGELHTSINSMAESLEVARHDLEEKIAQRTQDLIASRNQVMQENHEKRRLIQKVNQIIEEERKSIAIEIHDELNASLIAVRLQAQRIAQLSQQPESQNQAILQHAQNIAQLSLDLYNNGRNLVRRLRPEVLEMLGLQGAIDDMMRQSQKKFPDIKFTFDTTAEHLNPDDNTAISLYRIAQEALSNALKYANAKSISVTLKRDDIGSSVILIVSDDGLGFDTEQRAEGIGLTGIRERVAACQGEVAIQSSAGLGTSLTIRVPLIEVGLD